MAVHAHNLWLNLRHGQGRSWLRAQAWRALFDQTEPGDRQMNYRGMAGLRVHLYRWGELKGELRDVGFRIDEILPLDQVSATPIGALAFAHSVGEGGWIVFVTRP